MGNMYDDAQIPGEPHCSNGTQLSRELLAVYFCNLMVYISIEVNYDMSYKTSQQML